MINLLELITYLRDFFGDTWNVEGAAEFFAAEDRSRLRLPCFYISLGNFTALGEPGLGLLQDYDERIRIIYGCDNKQDRTGKYGQNSVKAARNALWGALLNKNLPNQSAHRLRYVGDSMLQMDLARYWHQFEFQQLGTIEPEDGWQEELDELNKVYVDYDLTESAAVEQPNAQDVIILEGE